MALGLHRLRENDHHGYPMEAATLLVFTFYRKLCHGKSRVKLFTHRHVMLAYLLMFLPVCGLCFTINTKFERTFTTSGKKGIINVSGPDTKRLTGEGSAVWYGQI